MNEETRKLLTILADKRCWSDDGEDFIITDYAGGNIEDAFWGGFEDGMIVLARQLLKQEDKEDSYEEN